MMMVVPLTLIVIVVVVVIRIMIVGMIMIVRMVAARFMRVFRRDMRRRSGYRAESCGQLDLVLFEGGFGRALHVAQWNAIPGGQFGASLEFRSEHHARTKDPQL